MSNRNTLNAQFWSLKCDISFRHNFTAKNAEFLLDTGANVGILPKCMLTPELLGILENDSTTVKGIGDMDVQSLGALTVSITKDKKTFENFRFLVVDQTVPPIIGLGFLQQSDLKKHTIYHRERRLEMVFDDSSVVNFELNLTRNVHPTRLNIQSSGQIVFLAKFNSLEEKLDYIRNEIGLPLNHSNRSELEAFADLVLKYQDIFGPETGNFPGVVEFHTKGRPRCARQRPVPSQYEEAVDVLIQKMLKNDIIEYCPDSKGWLTSLLVTPKNDGSPRICMNFKQTVNKSLIAEETFVQQSSEDIFNSIDPKNKFWSSMDLKSGYWQCKLSDSCKFKTAFQWRRKQYCFKRLPFGLTCAGNLFTKCISEALLSEKFDPKRVLCYLDDIFIGSPTFAEYLEHHERVFSALSKYSLKLNTEKCDFLKSRVKVLGRIVSEGKMEPDPEYVTGIDNIKAPKSKKQLQNLIGSLVWIKSFIGTKMGENIRVTNFSALMKPIFECGKLPKFEWTLDAQNALVKIKDRLKSRPFISMADPSLPFILATDASKFSLGGVLMQRKSENDYRVVALVSHTFNKTEQNWSTTEKECFAVVYCLRKLEFFLLGRSFVVQTDHKSLTWLDSTGFKNNKIRGWQDEICKFSFTIQYIPGRENVFADWLSRCDTQAKIECSKNDQVQPRGKFWQVNKSKLQIYIPSHVEELIVESGENVYLRPINSEKQKSGCVLFSKHTTNTPDKISLGPAAFLAKRQAEHSALNLDIFETAESQKTDNFLSPIIDFLSDQNLINSSKNGFLSKLDKSDPRYDSLKRYAKNMFIDAGSGALCVKTETSVQLVIPKVKIARHLKSAHDSMGHVGISRTMDYLNTVWWPGKNSDVENYVKSCEECNRRKGNYGALPVTSGINPKGSRPHQIVYADFIKMPRENGFQWCMTMIDSMTRYLTVYPLRGCSATEAADCVNDYIWTHGTPIDTISTDRGTHFVGSEFQKCLKTHNIHHQLHVSYRPQSSALVERCHRTLKAMIFILCKQRDLPWPKVLKRAVSAFNGCINSCTKVSPWEALRGTPYLIYTPNPKAPCAESVSDYSRKILAMTVDVQKAIRVANLEADWFFKQKQNSRHTRPPPKIGEKCCVYRPLSASKDKHFDWCGSFTVLESNEMVSQLRCLKTGKVDWYSNHQVKVLPRRPLHLESDSELDLELLQESSGAAVPVSGDSVKVPEKPLERSPPKSSIENAQNSTQTTSKLQPRAVNSKKASSSTRKRPAPAFSARPPSTRKRTKTEKLNIGNFSGQSYAAVAKMGPICA